MHLDQGVENLAIGDKRRDKLTLGIQMLQILQTKHTEAELGSGMPGVRQLHLCLRV